MSEPLDEVDKPPVAWVTLIVIGSFVFVGTVWFVSEGLLSHFIHQIEGQVELGMANKNRLDYMQEEKKKLTTEGKASDGLHHVPIEAGIDSFVKENTN
jgi:hypothetical protein